jgi:hypothetical protein
MEPAEAQIEAARKNAAQTVANLKYRFITLLNSN